MRRKLHLLLVSLLGAMPILGADTNLVFKDQRFGHETKLIWTATRTAATPLTVNVTFRGRGIGPMPLNRVGIMAAPSTGSDPCGASVEMFQARMLNEATFEGIESWRSRGKTTYGLFLFPTVFVGTTVLSVAGGGGPGSGGGFWPGPIIGAGIRHPVAQDVLGIDYANFVTTPATITRPPGTFPFRDLQSPSNVIIFGSSREFLLFEDCPFTAGMQDRAQYGVNGTTPVTLAINDPLQWRADFTTLFYVSCPSTGTIELELEFRWHVETSVVVQQLAIDTYATGMFGALLETLVRPAQPAVPPFVINMNISQWVVAP